MNLTYTGLELRRLLRDRAALVMTIGVPIALFLLYDQMWSGEQGSTATLMVMMGVFAVLASTVAAGTRIALERSGGWNRQLRLSALRPLAYVTSKGLTGWILGALAGTLVFGVGYAMQGSDAEPGVMIRSLLLLWACTVPFALLGVLIGYLASATSAQPLAMVVMLGGAFLGGVFVPLDQLPGPMAGIAHWYPSYWLNALAQAPFGEPVDAGRAVLVLACWTVLLAALVRWRYQRVER